MFQNPFNVPRFPASTSPLPRNAMRWVNFKELWCERLESRSPDSLHPVNVRTVLDRFTDYCRLVERDLAAITNVDLDKYIARRRQDKWRGKPLTNRTLNNEIAILNTALAYAGPPTPRGKGRKNLGLVEMPPFAESLQQDDPVPVAVSPDQIHRYLEALFRARCPRFPGLVPSHFWFVTTLLAIVTSLRRRALLLVPRPDDHTLLVRRELVVPAHLSKTRFAQRIPLAPSDTSNPGNCPVVEIIAGLPSKPGEPLLPFKDRRGRRMGAAYFTRCLCGLQREAGIPDDERILIKHLRSTAATELIEHFSAEIAKRRLGHSARSNTLHTNYVARRVTTMDQQASAHLADMILKPARDLKLFDDPADPAQHTA